MKKPQENKSGRNVWKNPVGNPRRLSSRRIPVKSFRRNRGRNFWRNPRNLEEVTSREIMRGTSEEFQIKFLGKDCCRNPNKIPVQLFGEVLAWTSWIISTTTMLSYLHTVVDRYLVRGGEFRNLSSTIIVKEIWWEQVIRFGQIGLV